MGEVRLRDRKIFCLANSMAGEEQFWKRRPSFTFEATISYLRVADSAQNTDQDQLQVSVKTARAPHVERTLDFKPTARSGVVHSQTSDTW